jgi:acyl carrier protein
MTGPTSVTAVKQFILDRLLAGEDPNRLTPTTPLISAGILDSMGLIELVAFLEEKFGVRIEAHEVDPANFDTLAAIDALVQRKLAR